MNIKQIFCKHIWEFYNQRLIGNTIKYVVDTPISEKKRYLQEYICVKCKKTKQQEQILERYLSLEEVKNIMKFSEEFGDIRFKQEEK